MSTVVYKAGIVAADTLAERHEWLVPGRVTKIQLIGEVVFAGVGDHSLCEGARRHFEEHRDLNGFDLEEHARVILICKGHLPVIRERKYSFSEAAASYYAWGSGSVVAMGAMLAGADAKQAVEIAMQLDPWTGGEVDVIDLGG